jgi:proteasome lid subunit RPN8/RPN11
MSVLELAPAELEAIRAHAAATYPNECCGALLGGTTLDAATRVLETLPVANTTGEGARRRVRVSAGG